MLPKIRIGLPSQLNLTENTLRDTPEISIHGVSKIRQVGAEETA